LVAAEMTAEMERVLSPSLPPLSHESNINPYYLAIALRCLLLSSLLTLLWSFFILDLLKIE
jgi:hypothetical protein